MTRAHHLFALLETQASPPTGPRLHEKRLAHRFFPFPHSGEVLTIDSDIWKALAPTDNAVILRMWPDSTGLLQAVEGVSKSAISLLATTHTKHVVTFDGTTATELPVLTELPSGFWFAGCDVIDPSGLSAIANIGFTPDEVSEIERMNLVVNQHGLLTDTEAALAFAQVASRFAPEHAPFSPVSIHCRRAN